MSCHAQYISSAIKTGIRSGHELLRKATDCIPCDCMNRNVDSYDNQSLPNSECAKIPDLKCSNTELDRSLTLIDRSDLEKPVYTERTYINLRVATNCLPHYT